MKKTPFEIRCIMPFAEWLDKHPTIHNVLLVLMGIAMAFAAFFYEFTTKF